jgi:hypothetical protein
MNPTNIPPGWHPDPQNPALSLRWWDGTQWTGDVRPSTPTAPPPLGNAWDAGHNWNNSAPAGWPPSGQPGPYAGQTFARRNQRSLTAVGVAAVYVLIAFTAHIVFFGILPILFSVRAYKGREPLAPLAIAAAAVAVVVAIVTLVH